MDKREALKIIGMIVDGLNPYKENFSSESIPENNPATIRALCTAIVSLLTKKDRNELASEYKQKDLAELIESLNGPLKWYFEVKEKEEILIALDEGKYNTKKAAEILRFTTFELDKKIKDYGLSPFVIAKKYIYEQNFMWMLFASTNENSKFRTKNIIEYYFNLAFQRDAIKSDFDNCVIDNIRKQLLIKAGIMKPILKESKIWNRIYKALKSNKGEYNG